MRSAGRNRNSGPLVEQQGNELHRLKKFVAGISQIAELTGCCDSNPKQAVVAGRQRKLWLWSKQDNSLQQFSADGN